MPTKSKSNPLVRTIVVLLQIAFGYGLVYFFLGQYMADDITAFNKFGMAKLPTTAITDLKRYAGTGQVVKVQGRIAIEEPLTNAAGEEIAFKAVTQEDKDGYIQDEWWLPSFFMVQDGKSHVWVELQHKSPDYLYLHSKAHGIIRDGQIPPPVAAEIQGDFKDLKLIQGDDIGIYTIKQDTPVTVFGVIEMNEGEPVLRPAMHRLLGKTVGRLILSTLTPDELAGRLRLDGYMAIFMCFALALPVLIVIVTVVWVEWKKTREAAVTTLPSSPWQG